jgi:hypothetical protein
LALELRIDPVAKPLDQSARVKDQPGALRRADFVLFFIIF